MTSILVAYATKYGSTKEVAEAVGARLGERGFKVDVLPAGEVTSVDGYRAVVLGGAFYYFRWLRDAHRFLKRNRAALEQMPVAVFGMGPFEDKVADFDEVREQLRRAIGKHEWLSPVAATVFGGAFDPERLRFPDNNPAMKRIPPADIRDWDAIRAWTDSLPGALGVRQVESG